MTDTTMRQRTEVFDRAVDRLRDMIAATKSPLERDIGELLTQRLMQGMPDGEAGKLLDGKKDLKGAAKALEEYARKLPRTGNCVGFGDCTALPVLLEYYGITAEVCENSSRPAAAAPAASRPGGAPSQASASAHAVEDPLSIDALLGV